MKSSKKDKPSNRIEEEDHPDKTEGKCLKDEMSSHIIEAVEEPADLDWALEQRLINIPNYGTLGPPDMCYVYREIRRP